MNKLLGGVLVVCALAQASADEGAPAKAPSRKRKAPAKKEDPAAILKLIGGGGGFAAESYPECMSVEDAAQRAQPSGSGGIGTLGGAKLTPPAPKPKRTELTECPDAIMTYVGAGHAAEPVGWVPAPLGVAATQQERKRGAKTCCYLIPPAPGGPTG